jgi:hypothetical protein
LGAFLLSKFGIHNPLGLVQLCAQLEDELRVAGFTVQISSDLAALDRCKIEVRGYRVGPMHDPDVCDFSNERGFWMALLDRRGKTVGLEAYRCDEITTSLADWLPSMMIGIYMRRQELMVPALTKPVLGSVAERLRGCLVYEGELWLSKEVKGKRIFDCFTRLGFLLSCIKWNPDAIWALTSEQMARHGHLNRIGFTTIERGILRWQWASKDVDPVEYLAAIEREGLKQMVSEMLLTAAEYRSQQTHRPPPLMVTDHSPSGAAE